MPRNGKNDKPHLSIARRPETDTKRVSLRSVVNKGSENILEGKWLIFYLGEITQVRDSMVLGKGHV